ncbi:hypothetical protein SBV1_3190007 [Verrucomicrobia bacterium]|nr:hypothetical protein SBV1_3190007 [Verrucomicrobiota bacterium]
MRCLGVQVRVRRAVQISAGARRPETSALYGRLKVGSASVYPTRTVAKGLCKNRFRFQGAITTNACGFGCVVAAGLAKRLECVQLAAAFECQACPKAPASRRPQVLRT